MISIIFNKLINRLYHIISPHQGFSIPIYVSIIHLNDTVIILVVSIIYKVFIFVHQRCRVLNIKTNFLPQFRTLMDKYVLETIFVILIFTLGKYIL